MSASTVSITANPSARRRVVEKRPVDLADTHNFSTAAAAATASPAAENGVFTIGGDTNATARDPLVQVRKSMPNNTVPPRRTSNTARKHGPKPEKPRWKTVLSILIKNLVLFAVVIGWIFMVKELMKGKFRRATDTKDVPMFQGNLPKMEEYLSSLANAMRMMQVQVDVIDKKIEKEIGDVKDEINEKIDSKNMEVDSKLKELDVRTLNLEEFTSGSGGTLEKWLSKEEFNQFLEKLQTAKGGETPSLDEVRLLAKEIVEREIEKHAADGLGRVDHALASGGAKVVKHSEPFAAGQGSVDHLTWLTNHRLGRVHIEAEKMLKPSFGEPGQCFALRSSSGFVQIRLRRAIIPTAVTLEHVAKSVAYDRSSAPKDCRVYGWLQGKGSTDVAAETQMFLLTEFTYDLEKSNVQTSDVLESASSSAIDTVMFEFISNHGSASHTCIYRLRVHGEQAKTAEA